MKKEIAIASPVRKKFSNRASERSERSNLKIRDCFVGTLCLLAMTSLFIAGPISLAQDFPSPRGYVNDFADILSNEYETKLNAFASELEDKTTSQIAIVTVDSIKPYEIEDYAVRLFEKWGIGKQGKDNGVLILLAVSDRRVRIEVGYGLEGAIPDAIAKQIIEERMIPFFKQDKYQEGLVSGSLAVMGFAAKEYNVELTGFGQYYKSMAPPKPSKLTSILNFIFTLLIFSFFISMRMGLLGWFFLMGTGRRRGGFWYGGGYGGNSGGFGGGFGGFGGGLSGGGGASGGW